MDGPTSETNNTNTQNTSEDTQPESEDEGPTERLFRFLKSIVEYLREFWAALNPTVNFGGHHPPGQAATPNPPPEVRRQLNRCPELLREHCICRVSGRLVRRRTRSMRGNKTFYLLGSISHTDFAYKLWSFTNHHSKGAVTRTLVLEVVSMTELVLFTCFQFITDFQCLTFQNMFRYKTWCASILLETLFFTI